MSNTNCCISSSVYSRVSFIRVIAIFVFIGVLYSCTPDTYTYYPSQRKINNRLNPDSPIYLVPPFASFVVMEQNDVVRNTNTEDQQIMESFAANYLTDQLKDKFPLRALAARDYNRDTLSLEFRKMVDLFYQTKSKSYSMKPVSRVNGYGVLLGMDWKSINTLGYHGRGGWLKTFYYLCIVNLNSGKVMIYKYHWKLSRSFPMNKLKQEKRFAGFLRNDLHFLVKRINRKLSKR